MTTTVPWSFEKIEAWARALSASGLGALEVEEDGFRLRIESGAVAPVAAAPASASSGAAGADGPASHSAGSAPPIRPGRPGAHVPTAGGTIVSALRVGYFQRATRKEGRAARPLQAGDAVDTGETLGEIVVLTVPYEVKSTAAGRIREILVEDGLGVEFGQPLFVLE